MEAMKERGEFVEMAEFSGNLYGTSKKAVHAVIGEGKICLLDIDVQGVRALRSSEGSSSDCDHRLKVIFVRPPSLEVLEKRLRDRGTESEEAIQKVTSWRKKMLNASSTHIFFSKTSLRLPSSVCRPSPASWNSVTARATWTSCW